jgi:hypothetical protein
MPFSKGSNAPSSVVIVTPDRLANRPLSSVRLKASRLMRKRPPPVVLLFDHGASAVLRDMQADVAKRIAEAKKAGFPDIWVRSVEKAIRLSLIAAVPDQHDVISTTAPGPVPVASCDAAHSVSGP